MAKGIPRTVWEHGQEFYEMMGLCIAQWASADEGLFKIFRHCVGPYEQSAIIYYRAPGLEVRLGLTDELVRFVLPKPIKKSGSHEHADVKRWGEIRNEISGLLSVRRRIAHQPIMVQSRMVGAVNTVPVNTMPVGSIAFDAWYEIYASQHERQRAKDSDQKNLTIGDLKNHYRAVGRVNHGLNNFFYEVLEPRLATPSQPNPPQPLGTSKGHA